MLGKDGLWEEVDPRKWGNNGPKEFHTLKAGVQAEYEMMVRAALKDARVTFGLDLENVGPKQLPEETAAKLPLRPFSEEQVEQPERVPLAEVSLSDNALRQRKFRAKFCVNALRSPPSSSSVSLPSPPGSQNCCHDLPNFYRDINPKP